MQHRREYGDAQTRCPDTMREAEALFEIDSSLELRDDTQGSRELRSDVDYKELQLLQNCDWAKRIALSVSGDDSDASLAKLDHALELDPNCVVARCGRARM
ncbi:hypothetical protein IWW38_004671 [Coemansia aciculifera]|uniref:Uncharacterized protein n=1 Tax=Coemansia aciculifera TaxID=417176 RepID=A0ACC1LXQ0_9FUNG|nr:hypothetical protein IWW38_004671 [Coemansia aciculifera]